MICRCANRAIISDMSGNLRFDRAKMKTEYARRRRVAEESAWRQREAETKKAIKKGTYKFRKKPRREPIAEQSLRDLYLIKKLSMREIAEKLGFSIHKISYWMDKYVITTRTQSEAVYVWNNPNGDPFKFKRPSNNAEAELYGLGLGLYWGEGTKASKDSIRLGNTDSKLINAFIRFLKTFLSIPKENLKFGLQIFSDTNPSAALDFWVKELKISRKQFYKVTVTKSRSLGTYRHKSQYGVLTVHYHNKKARDILIGLLPL